VSFSFVASVTNDADATIKVLSGGIVNGGTALFRNMMTVLNVENRLLKKSVTADGEDEA
jgi:hypothetical protein